MIRFSTLRICVCFFILNLVFVHICHAQKQIAMVTGEWSPYTSRKMKNYGQFTRIVTIVTAHMGIKVTYRFYPWKRCYEMVKSGRVWAAFPYSYTPERSKNVWFSDSIDCSKTVFFIHNNKKRPKSFSFETLSDLKAYRIGGVPGYFYEEQFKKTGINILYVYEEATAMDKLKSGWIDLMPLNEDVGWDLINARFSKEKQHFSTLDKPLNVSPLKLIISKRYPGSKKMLDRFNKALKQCTKQGLIKLDLCGSK